MLAIPRRIKGIPHPLINSMYMKEEVGSKNSVHNVLIIEAKDLDEKNGNNDVSDLLTDLHDIQKKIELRAGKFDRIDIKSTKSQTPKLLVC